VNRHRGGEDLGDHLLGDVDGCEIQVLASPRVLMMPTTFPGLSTSGPPLLPGLMGVSILDPVGQSRRLVLVDVITAREKLRSCLKTTPSVSVRAKPKGLPDRHHVLAGDPGVAGCQARAKLKGDLLSPSRVRVRRALDDAQVGP